MSYSIYRRFAAPALLAVCILLIAACVPAPLPTPAPAVTQPAAAATPAPTESSPMATSAPTTGAALEGQWEGAIQVAGQELGIVVRFQGSGSDLKAWLDIPGQGVKDNVLNNVSFDGTKVHFEAFGGARNALFDGELAADGSITGTFKQSSYTGTFNLKRAAAVAATPTANVPYRQEEVTFKNGAVTLAGTLTLPPTGGPFPVVVLISGSGPQNRDEELLGFKPFAIIADHFTRNGIAVLRYDDRGIGGSNGDFANSTSEDFAGDVQAAVEMLKSRRDIKPNQIGLLGHSEGGLVAPMVATRNNDVAFIIMMAGPGVRGDLLLERQVRDITLASGGTEAEAEQAVTEQRRLMEAARTGKGWPELEADMRETARKQIEAMPEAQRKALGDDIDKVIEEAVQAQKAAVTGPWFTFFTSYDPAPALEKVRVPVLALFGGKDTQVAAEPNMAAMKAAFERGGNNQVTFKVYPDGNHLFQPAVTGSPEEYANLKEFVPGFLDDMVKWIGETLKAI